MNDDDHLPSILTPPPAIHHGVLKLDQGVLQLDQVVLKLDHGVLQFDYGVQKLPSIDRGV